MSNIQRPKGTRDIYGNAKKIRNEVIGIVEAAVSLYNFQEIETPIFESKEVYTRTVGDTSDIVTKEMFDFTDKKGRELVLRPEGTAGTIRAIVENKLYVDNKPMKYFYKGPMFRYEKPQKGRQRQFTQFGVEMISEKSPYADVELIFLGALILNSLNIPFELKINSLGDSETRKKYFKVLSAYFDEYRSELTEDSIMRINTNPLRILDDKVDRIKDFVQDAPKISEFYSDEIRTYFDMVKGLLDIMNIQYEVDEKLVRGLDYYSDTAFEFVSTSEYAGSQTTIIGGGRYENLVEEFGGPDLSGVGFGIGIERLVNDYKTYNKDHVVEDRLDVFVLNITKSTGSEISIAGLVEVIRRSGLRTDWNIKPKKIQKGFEMLDQINPRITVIIGNKELEEGNASIRVNGSKETCKIDSLVVRLHELIMSAEGPVYEED